MPLATGLVRLFVSSTFVDFQAERDALHTRVFPRVTALCTRLGRRFQPIDLRWGISDAAAIGQLTLPVCMAEIERCQRTGRQPSFLALIGDRLGWRPPPAAIAVAEFDEVVQRIPSTDGIALVRRWYHLDENADPPEYRLSARTGLLRDPARWQPLELALSRTLRDAAAASGLSSEDRLKYEASATDQEIMRAVAGLRGQRASGVCVVRRLVGMPANISAASTQHDDGSDVARQRRDEITEQFARLCGEHVYRYDVPWADSDSYLEQFVRDIEAALSSAILADDQSDGKSSEEGGTGESAAHAAFADGRRTHFLARERELNAAFAFLTSSSAEPGVIVGPSGSGKSALMARLGPEIQTRHGCRIVSRFAGATPLCSTWTGMVASLVEELGATAVRAPGGSPDSALARVLRDWPRAEPLVLLIDAIDQLGADSKALVGELGWLPRPLPPHVHVLFSATNDYSSALERALPSAVRIEIGPLARNTSAAVLDTWLSDAGRRLQPAQRAAVLEAPGSVWPLYLRVAADACLTWRSSDPPRRFAPDLHHLLRQRLDDLTAPERHPARFVARVLGYVFSSRTGLTEDELIDLLSADPDVRDELTAISRHPLPSGRVPIVFWALLYQDVSAMLTERLVDDERTLGAYHRQFEAIVRERFVAEPVASNLHGRLAKYFQGRSTPRALAELPYQQAAAGQWRGFQDTMANVDYLIARVGAHGVTAVIEDLRLAAPATGLSSDDAKGLESIGRAIELSAHAVDQDPAQLRTHLIARLPVTDEGPVAGLRRQIESETKRAWVIPRRITLASDASPLVRSMAPQQERTLRELTADASGHTIIDGDDSGLLRVWDVDSGALEHTLGARGSPVAWLCGSQNSRAVAAGYRGYRDVTARLWDVGAESVIDEISPARLLAQSPDRSHVIIATEDGALVRWALEPARVVGRWTISSSPLVEGCFLRDGRSCVVADQTGEVWLVPAVGASPFSLWRAGAEVVLVTAAVDDRAVLVGHGVSHLEGRSATQLLVLDTQTGNVRWILPSILDRRRFSTNGEVVVGCTLPSGALAAFDLRSQRVRWTRDDGAEFAGVLAWRSHGQRSLVQEEELQVHSTPKQHRIRWLDLRSGRRGSPIVTVAAHSDRFRGGAGIGVWTWCTVEDTVHFSVPDGRTRKQVVSPNSRVVALVPIGDGRRFATASADGVVRLWRTPLDEPVRVPPVRNQSRVGRLPGFQTVARLFNTSTRSDLARSILPLNDPAVAEAGIRAIGGPQQRDVVVLRADGVERVDLDTWSKRTVRRRESALVSPEIVRGAVSITGEWAVYVDRSTGGVSIAEAADWPKMELVLWDVTLGSPQAVLAGTTRWDDDFTFVDISDDGSRVVFVEQGYGQHAGIQVWGRTTANLLTVATREAPVSALALRRDGLRVVAAWTDGAVHIYDLDESASSASAIVVVRPIDPVAAASGRIVSALAWSPDGRFVCLGFENGVVSIVSAQGSPIETVLADIGTRPERLVPSPDGSQLLAVATRLVWYRVATGEVIASLILDSPFVDAAFMDMRSVVAGDRNGNLHLLELRDPATD